MRFERLRYSGHARQRMEEREIGEEEEEEVLRVLNDPDLTYPSYRKRVAEDVFEEPGPGRMVRVVWVPDPAADARIVSVIDLEEER